MLPVTVTETVMEWVIEPLVPVIVSENVPAVFPVTVTVAVPAVVMLVGVIVAVSCAGVVRARKTVLLNPLIGCTVTGDDAEVPAAIVMGLGLDSEKSGGVVPVTIRASEAV